MKRGELFPLFCCSSRSHVRNAGAAHQDRRADAVGIRDGRAPRVQRRRGRSAPSRSMRSTTAPFTALVFKTHSEPHVGDVSYFRMFSGTCSNGQEVYNATRGQRREDGASRVPQGKERTEVPFLHPGDIGCVAKLKNTHTNDTLSTREHPVRLPQIEFPEPHRGVRGARDSARQTRRNCSRDFIVCTTKTRRSRRTTMPETHETIDRGTGRAASRGRRCRGSSGSTGDRRAQAAADRLSRDDHRRRRRTGPAQEAKRRKRPVRRLLGSHGPTQRGSGIRVRECRSSAARFRASSFRLSIVAFRKRRRVEFSLAIRWWISRSSCSTARTTRSTRTKCRSSWRAFWRSRPWRRSASRSCSSRSTKSRSRRPTSISATCSATSRRGAGTSWARIHWRRARDTRARGRSAGGDAPVRDGSLLEDARTRHVRAALQGLRADAGGRRAEGDRGIGEGERRRVRRGLTTQTTVVATINDRQPSPSPCRPRRTLASLSRPISQAGSAWCVSPAPSTCRR